jgi:hydroxyacid-oxoacid transhydrogenase
MDDVGAPRTLRELGYGDDDLAPLVAGAVDQRRLLVGAPREVGAAELEAVLKASL